MRRASLLAVVGVVLVMVFAGVAMAAAITCTGGRCVGTIRSDQITGSDQRDRIFALSGADEVQARAGEDELNGGFGDDALYGETHNDTYFGGRGEDLLSEYCCSAIDASNDEMNGGPNRDFIEGSVGDDILRGQEGSEHAPDFPQTPFMYGDPGNDELFGGAGDDAMEGEEGTDEHYGGDNNDFIDAANEDVPDAPDLVNCGSGVDTAVVLPNDRVRDNCEEVIDASVTIMGTSADEQQQQSEAFLAE
jgi:Ca2+-binding RTX toxin-like protein